MTVSCCFAVSFCTLMCELPCLVVLLCAVLSVLSVLCCAVPWRGVAWRGVAWRGVVTILWCDMV